MSNHYAETFRLFSPVLAADSNNRTRLAATRLFAATPVTDTDVGQRKIIFHRVGRVETAQGRGNLLSHAPVSRLSAGEAEIAADAADVSINRNDQLTRRNSAPQAKIDAVSRANHPAKKHAEPLAGTAGGGGGEQKTEI